jgi:hypothetical protein
MAEIDITEFKTMIKKGHKFIRKPEPMNGNKWDLRMAVKKDMRNNDPIYKYERHYLKNPNEKIIKVLKSIRPKHPYFLTPDNYGII